MEKTTYFVPHFDIETAEKFTQFFIFTDLIDLLSYVEKIEKRHNAYITRLVDNDGHMTVEMGSFMDDMIMYVNEELECFYMVRMNSEFSQIRGGADGRWGEKMFHADYKDVKQDWED